MIARIFLSLLLCGVLLYAWGEYRRSPIVALLSSVVSSGGLYFVWVPSHSTLIAEFAGIGRGVDLVLYTWVCINLIVLLNLHLKLRTQHELITALARSIALAQVTSPATIGPRSAGMTAETPFSDERTPRTTPAVEVDEHRPRQRGDRNA